MPPFAISQRQQNDNNIAVDKNFNFEVSLLVIAKKLGLTFEELNLMTLQDFIDYVDLWTDEHEETECMATQEDIDSFYSLM